METIRVFKTTIDKACVVSAGPVFQALILFTAMGCATPPSTGDLTAKSADQAVNSQSSASETGRSAGIPASSVKIIIYTDFQCGACERFHSRVEPELRARYVITGKAQIETRLLGALGDESLRAAEAALCAAEQGLFLEYQEALFRAWREKDADAYSTEELVKLAGSLGLDKEAFRRCLDSGDKKSELEKNLSRAKADGVHTLPAVLIDGVKIEGYRPLDAYRVMEIESPSRRSYQLERVARSSFL